MYVLFNEEGSGQGCSGVHPDSLGNKALVSVNDKTSYQTWWIFDTEKSEQL